MQPLEYVSSKNLSFMLQIRLAIMWDILMSHACDFNNNLFRHKCYLTHLIWTQMKAKRDADLLWKYCKVQNLICFWATSLILFLRTIIYHQYPLGDS